MSRSRPLEYIASGVAGGIIALVGYSFLSSEESDQKLTTDSIVEGVDYDRIEMRIREMLDDYTRRELSQASRIPIAPVAEGPDRPEYGRETIRRVVKTLSEDTDFLEDVSLAGVREANALHLGDKTGLGYDKISSWMADHEEEYGSLTHGDMARMRGNFEGMSHYDERLGLDDDVRMGIMNSVNKFQMNFMKDNKLTQKQFNALASNDPRMFGQYKSREWDLIGRFFGESSDVRLTAEQRQTVREYMARFSNHLQERIDKDVNKAKKRK